MRKVNNCPVCGFKVFQNLGSASDWLVTGKVFGIDTCLSCGFVLTNPRPTTEDLSVYYDSADYISHSDSDKGVFDKIYGLVRRFMLKRKSAVISSSLKDRVGVRLLDYGCATGEFLLEMQKSGYAVTGYEPVISVAEKARSKGLKVISGDHTGERISNLDNRFDVITLWHVLEHIDDLQDKIELFQKLIDNKGILVIAVPEYRSYDSCFYGWDWAAWDVPRHLNHFDEKTLSHVVENSGFTKVARYPLWFDSFYVALLSEKVKKSNSVLAVVRASFVGLLSNVIALLGFRPYSSQIYIFRKK